MTDHPLDERLRELADGYHRPPPTPADEMWAAIEAGLAHRGVPAAEAGDTGADVLSLEAARRSRAGGGGGWRTWGWGAAAAAVLALGIGIGRWTAVAPAPRSGEGVGPAVAEGPAVGVEPNGRSVAVRIAALEHLGRAEPLLAAVRVDARSGRLDPDVGAWGRTLLTETRLLLDADQAMDPAMRRLLEDLELILAQVAILSGDGTVDEARGREELRLIADGLEERHVVSRIQAALPAAPGLTSMD